MRTEGNRRLFSFNDVDKLLEIKRMLDQGLNIAGIKQILGMKNAESSTKQAQSADKNTVSDKQLRRILREDLYQSSGRLSRTSMRQGDMSRFFN